MTKKVVTLKPEDTLKKAVEKLVKNRISGAPVVEKGKIVGMISEKNILETIDAYMPKIHFDNDSLFAIILTTIKNKNELEAIRKKVIEAGKLSVKDVMRKNVKSIEADKTVFDAVKIMNRYKINRLPVIKSLKYRYKLVGIIARADIIRALE